MPWRAGLPHHPLCCKCLPAGAETCWPTPPSIATGTFGCASACLKVGRCGFGVLTLCWVFECARARGGLHAHPFACIHTYACCFLLVDGRGPARPKAYTCVCVCAVPSVAHVVPVSLSGRCVLPCCPCSPGLGAAPCQPGAAAHAENTFESHAHPLPLYHRAALQSWLQPCVPPAWRCCWLLRCDLQQQRTCSTPPPHPPPAPRARLCRAWSGHGC